MRASVGEDGRGCHLGCWGPLTSINYYSISIIINGPYCQRPAFSETLLYNQKATQLVIMSFYSPYAMILQL